MNNSNRSLDAGAFVVPSRVDADEAAPPLEDGHRKPAAARSPDDEASPVPGRSAAHDRRFAIHESGHALVQRLKNGQQIGGVTIQPCENPPCGGMVWSQSFEAAALSGDDSEDVSAEEYFAATARDLPAIGDPATPATGNVFLLAHARGCELMAGSEAEKLFLEGPPLLAVTDEMVGVLYASLISSNGEAIEKFCDFCRAEARALLTTYSHVVEAIANALIARRTLAGAEVDAIIEHAITKKSIADERERRTAWRDAIANAETFQPDRSAVH